MNANYRAIPAKLDFGDKELKSIVCGGQHMSCSVLHKWVPDEEAPACMACRKNFTPVRRRVWVLCCMNNLKDYFPTDG